MTAPNTRQRNRPEKARPTTPAACFGKHGVSGFADRDSQVHFRAGFGEPLRSSKTAHDTVRSKVMADSGAFPAHMSALSDGVFAAFSRMSDRETKPARDANLGKPSIEVAHNGWLCRKLLAYRDGVDRPRTFGLSQPRRFGQRAPST
jgi:hypothetical protein